jgi:hypothetical protein
MYNPTAMYIPTSPAYNPSTTSAYDVNAGYNPSTGAAYSPIRDDEDEEEKKKE